MCTFFSAIFCWSKVLGNKKMTGMELNCSSSYSPEGRLLISIRSVSKWAKRTSLLLKGSREEWIYLCSICVSFNYFFLLEHPPWLWYSAADSLWFQSFHWRSQFFKLISNLPSSITDQRQHYVNFLNTFIVCNVHICLIYIFISLHKSSGLSHCQRNVFSSWKKRFFYQYLILLL